MKTTAPAVAALALAATASVALATAATAQSRPAAARPAAAPATAAAPIPQGPPITGMCVISQERAIGQSAAGRAASERMKQLVAQVQAELKPEQDSLETEAKTFQTQSAALTAEQRQQRGAALQTRADAFQQKGGLRQRELQATQQKALGRIAQELDPVIRTLYAGKNCSILLSAESSVLVANPAMDLTDQAIAQLNVRLPTLTFDRERAPATPAATPAR